MRTMEVYVFLCTLCSSINLFLRLKVEFLQHRHHIFLGTGGWRSDEVRGGCVVESPSP